MALIHVDFVLISTRLDIITLLNMLLVSAHVFISV